MRTIIVSDLHLGSGAGTDLARDEAIRSRLFAAIEGADRVILLGDVIELRDRPLGEALELAAPFFKGLGEAAAEAEVLIVPGNHDHHLLEAWFAARRLERAEPLGLEERAPPDLAARSPPSRTASERRLSSATPGCGCATTSTQPTAITLTGT